MAAWDVFSRGFTRIYADLHGSLFFCPCENIHDRIYMYADKQAGYCYSGNNLAAFSISSGEKTNSDFLPPGIADPYT